MQKLPNLTHEKIIQCGSKLIHYLIKQTKSSCSSIFDIKTLITRFMLFCSFAFTYPVLYNHDIL